MVIFNSFNIFFTKSFIRITKRKDLIFHNFVNSLCLSGINKNTETTFFYDTLSHNRVVFLSGFLFGNRDFCRIIRNKKNLEYYFKFSDEISSEGNNILSKFPNKSYIMVGLCIRQGDYLTHEGGKYFLHDDQYITIIRLLRNQFANNVNFFIASEESKPNFPPHANLIISCGSPALNIYMLSKCNFLIGPPSTFLTWSSFYNSTPISYLDNSNWKQNNYSFSPATF